MPETAAFQNSPLADLRENIRQLYWEDEASVVHDLIDGLRLDEQARAEIARHAAELVRRVRADTSPTMMESFLAEYGLSTDEGVGLMCLAEALLRVPDPETIDELINDKIEPSNWGAHLGRSSSPLVNASTWALMLTGKVLDDDPARPASSLRDLIRRVGEPVVRTAVSQSMKLLGRQFVLGRTIDEALKNAAPLEAKGYTYSYDMLGEAARTEADALRYASSYRDAITAIARRAKGDVRTSPGISVKLSALYPRYEYTHRDDVMAVLVPRGLDLAKQAKDAGIGFNIDAEEADRLDLSLDIIEAILSDPGLAGWDGFGIVIQAYGKRALAVIEWLFALAERLDRKIMVRLVKGAYWDTEIKLAQELGTRGFPVFTRKSNTDVSYLRCAQMLLDKRSRIYPQFATHNAHSMQAILAMAGNDRQSYEFQRLHGMGESVHGVVKADRGTHCRIYAPVGAHRDLLAYLVRRLLENGANSSFVNQIVDEDIDAAEIARCPVTQTLETGGAIANPAIRLPGNLFGESRRNSRGWRINEPASILTLLRERKDFASHQWTARPMVASQTDSKAEADGRPVFNPADPQDRVGTVTDATGADVEAAVQAGLESHGEWSNTSAEQRAAMLIRASDLYEEHTAEFCALAAREAGKTVSDGIAEVREAVDFLRYYANEGLRLEETGHRRSCGLFVCISPWNFPLAIFSGQVAAALAAGNSVVAKPAEQTPLIAARAIALLHEAGIPAGVLQLLPGEGSTVGAKLTSDPRISGVCFTGSTDVARLIRRTLADNAGPQAVLIAETGGLNAMIVDSTALPEQAVRDILLSAFQSAGQRCSALRILYVQEDAKERLMEMLFGAMDSLVIGNPWNLPTDVSPVIDRDAQQEISAYCEKAEKEGRRLKAVPVPAQDQSGDAATGFFVSPSVLAVSGIEDMEREIFGPVLHVAGFEASELDRVVTSINEKGYGLTFGLHTRIDDRVQQVVERLEVGNIYVNRNQIGAIVGSQPFGGEGLSGTGPKAGGPLYVARFQCEAHSAMPASSSASDDSGNESFAHPSEIQAAIDVANGKSDWSRRGDRLAILRDAVSGRGAIVDRALAALDELATGPMDLPGPTGESNRLTFHPKGVALCLGSDPRIALAQAIQALAAGCPAIIVAPDADAIAAPLARPGIPIRTVEGSPAPDALTDLQGIAVVAASGETEWLTALDQALAKRDGPILLLETEIIAPQRYILERHVCIDTTAAGGNASLLAEST